MLEDEEPPADESVPGYEAKMTPTRKALTRMEVPCPDAADSLENLTKEEVQKQLRAALEKNPVANDEITIGSDEILSLGA